MKNTPHFKFAVNTCGKNKEWNFNVLAANFQDKEGTIDDLMAHIKQGHALCAGLLGGKRRSKANIIGSQWILIDIDNSKPLLDDFDNPVKDENGKVITVYSPDLTIEEALKHPFIKKHCVLAYTTVNHKPEWHKFRLIFLLPRYVEGADTVEACTRRLMQHIPHDPACKDASRVFYGNTEAEFFIINPEAVLPEEWVTDAIITTERERIEYKQRIQEIEERRKQFQEISHDENGDSDQLIQEALSYIHPRTPGSGNYDECRQVLMALKNHYGETEAIVLGEQWSPSIRGTTWNVAKKVKSFRRSGITIGTLFYIAQKYGFRFPKRQYDYQTRERIISRDEWESNPNRLKQVFTDFKSLFQQAVITTSRKLFKGFGRKVGRETTPALNNSADKVYKRENRKEIWRSAVKKGWRYIIDSSSTGTGKSHTVGDCKASEFDVEKIFYLASDHRNPTTLPIEENFTDLPTRHGGLVKDSTRKTPLGNDFLVNQNEDNRAEEKTPGTCHRSFLFEKLESKNIPNIKDSDSPICLGCHLYHACKQNSGNGFGFKHLRKLALTHSELRAHPDSMPKTDDFDYSPVGLFWDEADRLLKCTKVVSISLEDVEKLAGHLALKDEELYTKLKHILTVLRQILDKESSSPSYYGLEDNSIRKQLPQPPKDLPDIIAQIEVLLQPDLSFLQEGADQVDIKEVKNKGLKNKINKRLRQEELSKNCTELNQVLINWLPDFLSVWAGANGSFRCDGNKFTIYTLDRRHREIARSAKFNIFLSTTLRREDLALMLGISPDEILVIECERPNFSNLKIVHVTGMGNLGRERRDTMCDRVAVLKSALTEKHPDIAFLEWKLHAENGEGYHFRDGRGVNRFQNVSALASFGAPYPNLGEVLAQYQTLMGKQMTLEENDPEFQKFFDAKVQAEILQEAGRMRAQLRPDEELIYYFVGDYDTNFLRDSLPNATITRVESFTLAPEAGDKTQRTRWAILQAARKLVEEGKKLGQTAIAQLAGITQGRLSQIATEMGGWTSFKKLLVLLLDTLYNKTNNFLQTDDLDENLVWWAKNYLPLVVEHYSPEEVMEEVATVIKNYGLRNFKLLLERITPENKAHLLVYVVSLLPDDMQHMFINHFTTSDSG